MQRLQTAVEDGQWSIKGDPTEGALIVVAAKANVNKEDLEAKIPRIDEIPFDPKERYMVTFHKENEGSIQVFAKGAPEAILSLCNQVFKDGTVKELTQQNKTSASRNQHGPGRSSLKNIRHGIPNNQKQRA